MAQLSNGNEVVTPTKADAALAKESGQRLAVHLGHASGLRLEVKTGTTSEELVLPLSPRAAAPACLNRVGAG